MKRLLIKMMFAASIGACFRGWALDPAQTQVPPTGKPPSFKTERWDEDYSYLKTAPSSDPIDAIKYMPLSSDGDFYVTFGGQLRDRYESFNHSNFGSGPQDKDGYNLARISLYADVHATRYFRVFVEGRGAYENGRFGGPRLLIAQPTPG